MTIVSQRQPDKVTMTEGRQMTLLDVEGLVIEFKGAQGPIRASGGVSFSIAPGEVLGLVGESGSGKSVAARAIMGLVQPAGAVKAGSVRFDGLQIRELDETELRKLRAAEIAMIFQDPMSALNPVLTVGAQLSRVYAEHMKHAPENRGLSRKQLMARGHARALELLQIVRIAEPEIRLSQYPHQFSGGMRQRVMIAMALMCTPKLLIADEPTTALDATVELQVIELLRDLQRHFGMAILFISHNLGVVAKLCDRIIVMYAGRVVETAPVSDLFSNPRHPYTQALLASLPRGSKHAGRLQAIQGEPPDLGNLPGGCAFRLRCAHATEKCASTQDMRLVGVDHAIACHLDIPPPQTTLKA